MDSSLSFDVMVVDDDENVGTSTAEVLRSDGLREALAVTVEEARELLERGQVGCLIFDHHLVEGETNWTSSGRGSPSSSPQA